MDLLWSEDSFVFDWSGVEKEIDLSEERGE